MGNIVPVTGSFGMNLLQVYFAFLVVCLTIPLKLHQTRLLLTHRRGLILDGGNCMKDVSNMRTARTASCVIFVGRNLWFHEEETPVFINGMKLVY